MRDSVLNARYSSVCNVCVYGTSCLKCVIVYLSRDILAFAMYCIYGTSRSSLLIGNILFKMCDSVLIARYSSVCNVLRLWNISLIPTYRVYRLYDMMYIMCLIHTTYGNYIVPWQLIMRTHPVLPTRRTGSSNKMAL